MGLLARLLALSLIFIIVSCVSFFRFLNAISKRGHISQVSEHGGECEAIGPRLPPWANRTAMLEELPLFAKVYEGRPFKDNSNGMRLDHSFALWFILRASHPKPSVVIESGAYRGHSTWLISQALPDVRIISISPEAPSRRISHVTYLVEDDFRDFSEVDWSELDVDPATAFVFFDDHQSGFRRVIKEGMRMGFRKFVTEDNYDYLKGDNMSLKWVCELTRKDEWRGVVKDNFGKVWTQQTWEEHLELGQVLAKHVRYYYEFPPIAATKLTKQTRFDENRVTRPLVHDKNLLLSLVGRQPNDEYNFYTQLCFVEIKD